MSSLSCLEAAWLRAIPYRHCITVLQTQPVMCRWLAARAVHARSARVLGGGWSCADLRCVMAALSRSESLHTLRLECVHDVREAVCIDSELAGSSIRHLTFHGSHACQLPATLRSLELWIWPIGSINADKDELLTKTLGFAHLLHGVQPLPVLSSLLVTSYGWDLPGVDAQILAGSFPALQQLQIHMLLTPRARFTSDLKYLADLLPSVPVHLTVRAFACEVPRLLQQLQQVRLASLDLSCLRRWSHATGTDVLDAVEPLLAQCSVQQFTLRLDDSWPQGMRLCQEPHGVVVVYARADKWLALEAADVAWQLRSGA